MKNFNKDFNWAFFFFKFYMTFENINKIIIIESLDRSWSNTFLILCSQFSAVSHRWSTAGNNHFRIVADCVRNSIFVSGQIYLMRKTQKEKWINRSVGKSNFFPWETKTCEKTGCCSSRAEIIFSIKTPFAIRFLLDSSHKFQTDFYKIILWLYFIDFKMDTLYFYFNRVATTYIYMMKIFFTIRWLYSFPSGIFFRFGV